MLDQEHPQGEDDMRRARILFACVTVLAMGLVAGSASAATGAGTPERAAAASSGRRLIRPPVSATTTSSSPHLPSTPWSSIASMTTGVTQSGGGAFSAQRFYVPGGYTGATTLTDAMQVYNPATNSWITLANDPLPAGPWADAAVCTDPATGKIYVLNGVDGSFFYAAMQVFNPSAAAGARWSPGVYPQISPTNVYFSQGSGCSVISGILYLYGGYGLVGDPAGTCCSILNKTWAFNIATQTWSDTGKPMAVARLWFAYMTVGAKAAVAGGDVNLTTDAGTARVEKFDPATGWSNLPNMPQARVAPGIGFINGIILIYGGVNFVAGVIYNSTLACQVSAGCAAWGTTTRTLNTARAFFMTAIGAGSFANRVFLAGGSDSSGNVLSSAEQLP
jgi:hypothetical protein